MHNDLVAEFDFLKERNWLEHFLHFDTSSFERLLRTKKEDFWQKEGERRALLIFREAAQRVPAYKHFLKTHRVRVEKIKTIADFTKVPITTKDNYISRYPIAARSWGGKLHASDLIAVSSGTTGEPKFWPRSGFQEFEAGVVHELIYRSLFQVDKYKTLLLIGFPMGVYVSGVATLSPSLLVANKIRNLTVMSPGNNKIEMLRAIKHLAKNYERVVLVGHPFFLKDVIESGKDEGIRWSKMNLRVMSCSEGFSESWREY